RRYLHALGCHHLADHGLQARPQLATIQTRHLRHVETIDDAIVQLGDDLIEIACVGIRRCAAGHAGATPPQSLDELHGFLCCSAHASASMSRATRLRGACSDKSTPKLTARSTVLKSLITVCRTAMPRRRVASPGFTAARPRCRLSTGNNRSSR